jgi:hypothetical protein
VAWLPLRCRHQAMTNTVTCPAVSLSRLGPPAQDKNTAACRVAALAAVASYLINALAQVTSALRPARPISPYYLMLGNEPLAHGFRLIGAVSVLAAVAAITAAGASAHRPRPVQASPSRDCGR